MKVGSLEVKVVQPWLQGCGCREIGAVLFGSVLNSLCGCELVHQRKQPSAEVSRLSRNNQKREHVPTLDRDESDVKLVYCGLRWRRTVVGWQCCGDGARAQASPETWTPRTRAMCHTPIDFRCLRVSLRIMPPKSSSDALVDRVHYRQSRTAVDDLL